MKLNKKKITILICLFFFLLVYFLLSSLIFAKNEGLAKLVRDNTPFAIKNFLKQTVFIIPTLKKQNLILERNILLSEALCGVKFKIFHLDGREILIKTDDIIRPNEEYLLSKEGLSKDNYNYGDLIVRFNIIFPESLNKERKHYISKILPIQNEEEEGTNKEGTYKEGIEVKFLENAGEKINMEEVNLDEQPNIQEGGVECAQQ